MAAFRLNGKKYKLDREEVEAKLKGIQPKAVQKYAVEVNGRPFPPKQAIAEALDLPLITFTTMDASRALAAIGFEVRDVTSGSAPVDRTLSEEVFEQYLEENGLLQFEFEPKIDGTARRPDYRLLFGGREVLIDVKEFRATRQDFRSGFGSFDPYGVIREKLDAGRKKFKDLDGRCCALVLYNVDKPLVHLDWRIVYGAMLGNLGWRLPFNPTANPPVGREAETVFTSGGKMHRERDGEIVAPQNRTISAVIALRNMPLGQRRLGLDKRRREQELGRRLSIEEFWNDVRKARGTDRDASLMQIRVVVHENPYAATPLPRDLFSGPCDERFGDIGDGRVSRLFVGNELQALEIESASLPKPPADRLFDGDEELED